MQLAKLAGCQVIGTCSTDAKAEFLKVGSPVKMLTHFCDWIISFGNSSDEVLS